MPTSEYQEPGLVRVVSRPCFEVWLIAHYTAVRRYADQHDARRHFRELVPRDLPEKELPRDFPYGAVQEAVDRSHLPTDELGEADVLPPTPGTAMPHLVTRLGLVGEAYRSALPGRTR